MKKKIKEIISNKIKFDFKKKISTIWQEFYFFFSKIQGKPTRKDLNKQ